MRYLDFEYRHDESLGICIEKYLGSDTVVNIPERIDSLPVAEIDEEAFSGCSSLKSVTIPDSVKWIGHSAFGGCSSLTSVTILSSLIEFGEGVFSGCSKLNTIHSKDKNIFILDQLVYKKNGWLEGVDGITIASFIGNLTEILIPHEINNSAVTRIGHMAFENCISLTSVIIPCSVTEIGWSAFSGCSSLKSVTIPDSVTKIGGSAFSDCSSLTSVTIPNSVRVIENATFNGCRSLSSITIPDSVTEIEIWAFSGCSSLKSVTIPDSVIKIESWAFGGCSSLTSVTIPYSVTEISVNAFNGCSSLKSITVPELLSNQKCITDLESRGIKVFCYEISQTVSAKLTEVKNLPNISSKIFDWLKEIKSFIMSRRRVFSKFRLSWKAEAINDDFVDTFVIKILDNIKILYNLQQDFGKRSISALVALLNSVSDKKIIKKTFEINFVESEIQKEIDALKYYGDVKGG